MSSPQRLLTSSSEADAMDSEDVGPSSGPTHITSEDTLSAPIDHVGLDLQRFMPSITPKDLRPTARESTLPDCGKYTETLVDTLPEREPANPIDSRVPSGGETFSASAENLSPGSENGNWLATVETERKLQEETLTGDHAKSRKCEAPGMSLFAVAPQFENTNNTASVVDGKSLDQPKEMLESLSNHTSSHSRNAQKKGLMWPLIPGEFPTLSSRIDVEPPQFIDTTSQPTSSVTIEDQPWESDSLQISYTDDDSTEDVNPDFTLKDGLPPELQQNPTRANNADLAKSGLKRRPHEASVPRRERVSAFGSLADFMDTRRACKKPRLHTMADKGHIVRAAAGPLIDAVSKSLSQSQRQEAPKSASGPKAALFALPVMPHISSPRTIIVSSKLLNSQRQLVQALENGSDPPLTIIYRDLDSSRDKEAQPDIIISPTVAALLTTLQQTTQRALPGRSSARGPLLDRIFELSGVYDRLLVITTLPQSHIVPFSAATTCSQILTLTSFCASLSNPGSKGVVECILVPTLAAPTSILPTESQALDPLHRWTLFLALRYALDPSCTSALPLLPDETLWELFLRKVGMNAYAAQVVLGTLKKPKRADVGADGSQGRREEHESVRWGLGALVSMGAEERVRLFEDLVGRKAVERLSVVIDSSWENV
jgi:hypothetical protein